MSTAILTQAKRGSDFLVAGYISSLVDKTTLIDVEDIEITKRKMTRKSLEELIDSFGNACVSMKIG